MVRQIASIAVPSTLARLILVCVDVVYLMLMGMVME
jgi:hypothetical protein